MVTVKTFSPPGFNITVDLFPISASGNAVRYVEKSSYLEAFFNDGYSIKLSGSNFTYRSDQTPTGGEVNTIQAYFKGKPLNSITGLELDLKKVADASLTDTFKDDDKLEAAALKGDDVCIGGATEDEFFGYAGKDRMSGGSGDDFLHGGTGNDRLAGGKGYDGFVFDEKLSSKSNVDTVSDFAAGVDTIWLFADIFKALDRVPKGDADGRIDLAKDAFAYNKSGDAQDKSDRIIYDRTDGHLYYDADGSGGGRKVLFADLADHLKLSASDFQIYA